MFGGLQLLLETKQRARRFSWGYLCYITDRKLNTPNFFIETPVAESLFLLKLTQDKLRPLKSNTHPETV